jgi:hypothetical protein
MQFNDKCDWECFNKNCSYDKQAECPVRLI